MQLPTMYDVVPMIVKPATAKTKGGDGGNFDLRNEMTGENKKRTREISRKVVFRASKVIFVSTVQPNFKQVRGFFQWDQEFLAAEVPIQSFSHKNPWMSSCRTGGVMNSPNLWKPWNMPHLDSNTSGKPSDQKRNDCCMNCAYQYIQNYWKTSIMIEYICTLDISTDILLMYITNIYWWQMKYHYICQALTSTHLRLLNWSNNGCRSGEGESPTDRVLSNNKQRGTFSTFKKPKRMGIFVWKTNKTPIKGISNHF